MTLDEFKAAHIYPIGNPILGSFDNNLNILYNDYGGLGYRLDAIAIRITSANRQQLAQATQITCGVGAGGTYTTVDLQSKTVPVEVSVQGEYYIYAIAPEISEVSKRPLLSPTIVDGVYLTYLVVEPSISIDTLSKNEYTVLFNSDVTTRTSKYMQISDRVESTLNPVNLESIIAGTAISADTQDSLYSDTGWINGRYEGTKATAQNYGGIDPTITGISFTGIYYPLNVDDTSVRTASTDARTTKEYFFIPGKGVNTTIPVVTVPSDASAPTAVYEASGQTSPTRTTFDFEVTSGATEVAPIQVGDYMYLYNVDEIVKVEQVERVGGTTNTTVKRYMFGTNPNPTTSVVTATARVMKDISRLYQVGTNKVEFVGEGKIWIQASGDILQIDQLGYSATGSVATS